MAAILPANATQPAAQESAVHMDPLQALNPTRDSTKKVVVEDDIPSW